jgi:hypothetical protein
MTDPWIVDLVFDLLVLFWFLLCRFVAELIGLWCGLAILDFFGLMRFPWRSR